MNKRTIFIIGNTSEIAKNLFQKYYSNDEIIGINSSNIDFNELDSGNLLRTYLNKYSPDLIFIFSGVIGKNESDYNKVFNVNFKPFHEIIKFFSSNTPRKKTKVIILGSKCFNEGREEYYLYSASKAALHNLFLSACTLFKNTQIIFGIIHLPKIKTKMIKNLSNKDNALNIDEASNIIFNFEKNIEKNSTLIYDLK